MLCRTQDAILSKFRQVSLQDRLGKSEFKQLLQYFISIDDAMM